MEEDLTKRSASRPACRIDGTDAFVPLSLNREDWTRAIHISTYMAIDLLTRRNWAFGPCISNTIVAHYAGIGRATIPRATNDLIKHDYIKQEPMVSGSRWANGTPSPLAPDIHCKSCGALEPLVVDHIVPVSLGGGDGWDNKQLLCCNCNMLKGDRLPENWRRIENE